MVMSTRWASSPRDIFLLAIITSRFTTIPMLSPALSNGQVLILFQLRRLPEQGGHDQEQQAAHEKGRDKQRLLWYC